MEERPLLFYSAWPLEYHNVEAKRKALGLAGAGFAVTYVAGVGIRNPRFSNVAKLRDRVGRKLRSERVDHRSAGDLPLRQASVLVAPPRQLAPVHRFNAAWMERQLRQAVQDWERAVAWVRWPTPELVDALSRIRPAATVYECVDAYHLTPGITGHWATRHERAEGRLLAQSDAVVVPSTVLGERFRGLGVDVHVVPHGVDLWPPPEPSPKGKPTTVGFVGTLDYKLDLMVVRHIAKVHPEWRLRLIGPVQEGFRAKDIAGFGNLIVEPPVPHDQLGQVLADFDLGMMPYLDSELYQASCPIKHFELLAAGLPAVARPCPALMPFDDLLYFATTPALFVRELERALQEDSPARRHQRRAVAEANSWDRRVEELLVILDDLLSSRPT